MPIIDGGIDIPALEWCSILEAVLWIERRQVPVAPAFELAIPDRIGVHQLPWGQLDRERCSFLPRHPIGDERVFSKISHEVIPFGLMLGQKASQPCIHACYRFTNSVNGRRMASTRSW
jgi:hypothetical protein